MRKFNSQADEIRYYVKGLLKDGKPHTVKEMKAYTERQSNKEFTEGAFAGAFRELVKNDPSYFIPKRGVYQSVDERRKQEGILEKKIINLIRGSIEDLFGLIGTINPLTITDKEQVVVNVLKETVAYLNQTIEKLGGESTNENQ